MATIPKLFDWYMLDFAKDLDTLLDWVCLQLPHEVGKEAMNCLERNKNVQLSHCLRVTPYECCAVQWIIKEDMNKRKQAGHTHTNTNK